MSGQNRLDNPDPYLCCGHLAGHDGPCETSVGRTDVLARLMELWELPWSEERYGEAQMLLAQIRHLPASGDHPFTPELRAVK